MLNYHGTLQPSVKNEKNDKPCLSHETISTTQYSISHRLSIQCTKPRLSNTMAIMKEGRRLSSADNSPARKERNTGVSKVRFGRNTCRWFLKDLTKEEIGKVWYQREDYIRIQSNNHAQIRGALGGCGRKDCVKNHGMRYNEETLNVRGLEHHFPGRVNEKRY